MISIVIPFYKHKNKLLATLASLREQTYQDVEVIIVDDGNEPPLSLDSNVRIIHQAHAGAAVARNTGASVAKEEYLLFLDADIVMEPDMLEKMVTTLEQHTEVSYVYSQFKFGFKTFKLWPFDEAKLKQMPYIHTTSLMRRAGFLGFDPAIKRLQDWDLWLTMLEHDKRGIFIPEILFSVKTGGSISTWLPSFLYNFKWLPWVKKYNEAMMIVKKKHMLVSQEFRNIRTNS